MSTGIGLLNAEDVRAQLQRVVASPEFASSPRLARFLTFVVETLLAGDGGDIKESLIAVEVYGRRPDYNPQIDSTVRVEAGRLRARLRQYYETTGSQDLIKIEVPKGTYVPAFVQIAPVPEPDPVPVEVSVIAEPPLTRRYGLARILLVPALLMAVFAGFRSHKAASALDSIAVLPFVNLSEGSSERLSDGITDDVTTGLARIEGLRVPARTIMMRYKNKPFELSEVRKQHGVGAVLEGSIRREGDRLFVTAQLIDANTGYHLWAETYQSDRQDVAGRIVSGVGHVLRGEYRATAEPDEKTMELYHRAQELLRIPVLKKGVLETVPPSVVEAVQLFQEVTRRSPTFAKGWTGLAEAAEWEYELRGNEPADRLVLAKTAAKKAVELDPKSAEAWTVLTSILFFREWDIPGAEAAVRRAIELHPRNTAARQRYVDLLRIQGRIEEAQAEVDRAIESQPATAALRVRKAVMLYQSGDADGALQQAQIAESLTNQNPAFLMALWVKGLALQTKGRFAEAEAAYRAAINNQPHDPWNEPALGHLLAATGRAHDAETILTELERQLGRGKLTYVSMALVQTALGRKADAIESLERGWSERDDAVLFIGVDPRFRPLHNDPRFQQMLSRLRRTLS